MIDKDFDLVILDADVLVFEPNLILRRHHIGIRDGVIAEITTQPIRGAQTIDGMGKVVMPGFIDFHSHVDGKRFSAECMLRQGATTTIGGERNFDGSVIRKIAEEGFLINHGFYISHSFTLRKAVGIVDPYQEASRGEIDSMVQLAAEFLESGAFGIHFGLEFAPGTTTNEIVAMAKVARAHDRKIVVHLRKDGPEALDTLTEIFGVVQETGVAAHILHLSYMVGIHGVMDRALDAIDEAIASGLDITADTGLYDAYPACIGAPILDGDLSNKYGKNKSVKDIVISSGIRAGESCDEETFALLRDKYPNTLITAFVFDEKEISKALVKPYVYVSTNAADGPHYQHIGHPETCGTFPRLLGKYVRQQELLDIITAVQKITSLPAKRFGIANKGEIALGKDADLVIVDIQNIIDQSNYINVGDPNAPPVGIHQVLVNGQLILDEGKILKETNPGHILLHENSQKPVL